MTSKLPPLEEFRSVLREELDARRGLQLVDRDAERSVLASVLHGLAVDADPNDYEDSLVKTALRITGAYGLPVGQVYEREHLVALAVRIHPSEGLADDEIRQAHLLRELERVVFHVPVVAGRPLVGLTRRLRQLATLRRTFAAVAAVEAGVRVALEQGSAIDVLTVRDQLVAAVAPLNPERA